jgi:hypothetical protein
VLVIDSAVDIVVDTADERVADTELVLEDGTQSAAELVAHPAVAVLVGLHTILCA